MTITKNLTSTPTDGYAELDLRSVVTNGDYQEVYSPLNLIVYCNEDTRLVFRQNGETIDSTSDVSIGLLLRGGQEYYFNDLAIEVSGLNLHSIGAVDVSCFRYVRVFHQLI